MGDTYDIGQLGLSDQVLCLSPNELLLQHHNSRAVGLLQLQLLDIIGDLALSVPTRLYALLGISDRLENSARVV